MMKKVVTILMVVLGVLAISQLMAQETKKICRIQVFATKDRPQADSYAQQLISQGYSPVVVRQRDKWWEVKVGEFKNYADTLYLKNAMRKGAFPDAFISKDDVTSPGASIISLSAQELKIEPLFKDAIKKQWKPVTTKLLVGTEMATVQYQRPQVSPEILRADNNTLSEQDLFNKALSYSRKAEAEQAKSALQAFLQRFPRSERVPRVKLHLAYWTFKDSTDAEAEQKFKEVKQGYPNREEAGEAALRIGYIKLRNKDKDSALREFEEVARGLVKASDEVRLEAMLRCAKMYHASNERVRALQAYRECAEITDRTAFDPNVHLEIAGLYMEIARSGAGSLDDCIEECDRVLACEDGPITALATALQMKAESYYFKQDYDQSIAIANEVLKKYNSVRPMAMLAQFYAGMSLLAKDHYYEAAEAYNRVVERFSDADNLPGNNLRSAAKIYQAKAFIKLRMLDRARKLLQEIDDADLGDRLRQQKSELLRLLSQ